jgi:hypothetical protein
MAVRAMAVAVMIMRMPRAHDRDISAKGREILGH